MSNVENKMQTIINSRTTDQLLNDLEHLATIDKTPDTRMVAAMISDTITTREGIDEQLDTIYGDLEFEGTYLDAIRIALANKQPA